MFLTMLAAGDFDLENIFTTAGTVLTGVVGIASDFLTTLWGNPIGKISLTVGVIGLGIGIAYKITRLRRK